MRKKKKASIWIDFFLFFFFFFSTVAVYQILSFVSRDWALRHYGYFYILSLVFYVCRSVLFSMFYKERQRILSLVKNNYSKLVICLLSISWYVFKMVWQRNKYTWILQRAYSKDRIKREMRINTAKHMTHNNNNIDTQKKTVYSFLVWHPNNTTGWFYCFWLVINSNKDHILNHLLFSIERSYKKIVK